MSLDETNVGDGEQRNEHEVVGESKEYVPVLFWFTKNPGLAFPMNDRPLPLPENMKRRPYVCECIRASVNDALDEWIDTGKLEFENKGITNIFDCAEQNNDWSRLNEHGDKVILEVLVAIKYMNNMSNRNAKSKIYMPELIQKRYDLSWDQAMVILHSVENEYAYHGVGQRCPNISDKGERYVAENDPDGAILTDITWFCSTVEWTTLK